VSPDGKRIAAEIGTGSGSFDVWLYDIESRGFSRLTNNFTGVRPLGWSVDGRRVYYLLVEGSGPGGIMSKRRVASIPWDLSAPPETLTADLQVNPEDASIGPAHSTMAIRFYGYGSPGDISIAPLDSPTALRAFVTSSADDETPRLSADGTLLAYGSDETGQYEVYVRPVTGGAGRIQISAGGGSEPVWSRDGRGLYYRGPDRLMFAAITTTPQIAVTRRDTLFDDPYGKEIKAVQYDAFPNGELLMLKRDTRSFARPALIMNWSELLKRRNK
jgi:serine/threonine-protein kinase